MIYTLSTLICCTKDTSTINQFKNIISLEEIKHFLKYFSCQHSPTFLIGIFSLDIKSQKSYNQSIFLFSIPISAVTTQHFRFLHAHVAISNRSVLCEYENEVSILANIRCSFSLRLLNKRLQGRFYFVRYEVGQPLQLRME